MSKYLVLTIAVGQLYEEMTKSTHPTFKAYANKIGADFLAITKSTSSSPHWEKFQIYDLLNKYERILYIDSDILIRPDSPNIFDIVPKDKLGAFNEAPWTDGRQISIYETCQAYDVKLPNWNGAYYNTGVMVISRIHKQLFKKPEKEFFNFYEQGYLNMIFHKTETWMFDLDYKFNRMSCMDRFTGEERFASYFMHYAGFPNINMICGLIADDLKKWQKDNPKFKYQRHILIDVQGGLGDQIDAEPAIRFMKKYVYPEDDIIIKTHFPRLFEHLNLPTYLHQDVRRKADTPYFYINTLPNTETVTWSIVSNLLCHTVDYCSIAVLRRTLPFEDKRIHLNVNKEDLEEIYKLIGDEGFDYQSLVLVHPGRHWQSKTFPKEYWQNLVNNLHSAGLKVCLIGRDADETRGVWDIDTKPGMLDTRNLLSLGGLIALISKAGTLLSNDSAPIHIAGAFNNNIVLIPTCKHPDHILPYRFPDRNYKQCSIYKKLTLDDCDSAPTTVHGSSAEFIKNEWSTYLPEAQDVVDKIKKLQ